MKRTLFLALVAVALVSSTSLLANTTQGLTMEVTSDVSYEEIKVDELPAQVKEAVAKDFEGSEILKAYKGSDSTYKVVLKVEGAKKEVIYSKEGKKIG